VSEPRLASGLLASALLRRVGALGGHGAVLSRGDATAGAILLVLVNRGVTLRLLERGLKPDGGYGWIPSGPKSIDASQALTDYLERRRRNDPDLWILELDAAEEALAELLE
jgi:hypothetical protein